MGASSAAPRTSSREPRHQGEQQAHLSSAAAEQMPPAGAPSQRPPRSGPPVPVCLKPDMAAFSEKLTSVTGTQQPGSNAGDSLMDLLRKPLLPKNGPLYERLADQMLEPRQDKGRVSKAGRSAHSQEPVKTNYDDEARKLWARLNLDPNTDNGNGAYNSLDPVWRNPETGGTIYVGNEVAAKSLGMLQKHNITHVVNCTDSIPLYHQNKPGAGITYLRFDITSHYHRVRTEKEAVVFVQPMLDFVTEATSKGNNVMVHCLAGAHRAGTTGVLCLMHFAKLGATDATFIAKQCRPIIDPICDFPLLLARVERGWFEKAHGMS